MRLAINTIPLVVSQRAVPGTESSKKYYRFVSVESTNAGCDAGAGPATIVRYSSRSCLTLRARSALRKGLLIRVMPSLSTPFVDRKSSE